MPIERWYGYVRCDNFIGKVRFVRAGGGFLLAETPRHNWPTHGAGGDFIYYDAHKFTSPLDTINV